MKIFFTRLNHGFITLQKSCTSEEILTRHWAVFCPHVFRDTAHFVTYSDHFSELRNPFFQTLKNTLQSWNWVLKASSFSVTQFQNRHFGTYIPAYYFVICVKPRKCWSFLKLALCVKAYFHTPPNSRASHSSRLHAHLKLWKRTLCLPSLLWIPCLRREAGHWGGRGAEASCPSWCYVQGGGGGGGRTDSARPITEALGRLADGSANDSHVTTSWHHEGFLSYVSPSRPPLSAPHVVCKQCTMRLAPFISPYHIKPATQYFER